MEDWWRDRLLRALELVRRWPDAPPALSSVFSWTISFSDMPRLGRPGRSPSVAVGAGESVMALAGGCSWVGEMRASGEVCWKELEFLRMPARLEGLSVACPWWGSWECRDYLWVSSAPRTVSLGQLRCEPWWGEELCGWSGVPLFVGEQEVEVEEEVVAVVVGVVEVEALAKANKHVQVGWVVCVGACCCCYCGRCAEADRDGDMQVRFGTMRSVAVWCNKGELKK